jgi:hypothetical protein
MINITASNASNGGRTQIRGSTIKRNGVCKYMDFSYSLKSASLLPPECSQSNTSKIAHTKDIVDLVMI